MAMQNGQTDEQGRTLEAFLAAYNPGEYERPSVTVDVAVLTDEGEVLLILRRGHPNINTWALPGGFIEMGETLLDSAQRELREETGLQNMVLQPIGMFGEPTRDPRTRIITAAFAVQTPRNRLTIAAGDDAADAKLFRWRVEALGEIRIPQRGLQKTHDIVLPCTATGDIPGEKGQGFGLLMTNGNTRISARIAESSGIDCLLDGTLQPGDQRMAGDHALIVFTALRTFGLV